MLGKIKDQRSKIKVAGQKAFQYSVLLTIKEGYLFSRNLLGLILHPFKTIRVIFREEDYSQALLIFGLPFYLFIFGLLFIIVARFLIHAPASWGWLAKASLLLVFSASFLIFTYLAYWIKRVKSLK